MFNLYSVGHFIQWFLFGRFLFNSWLLFFLLSIGWEILEIFLPFDFAKETLINKVSDILVNYLGFLAGKKLKNINIGDI